MTAMPPTPWLVRARPVADPRLRLYCLPHAGAGPSVFTAWARALPADIELCAIHLPGREVRLSEPAATRMTPLVDAMAAAVAPTLDRPYAVFGHSMGATVGFELVRALRRRGAPPPSRLWVAGRRAPHLPTPRPWRHTLSGPEFMAELRRLGGTPPELLADPDLAAMFAAILRADFAVLETHAWTPEPALESPIVVLHGTADLEVSHAESAAWASHSTHPLGMHEFSGGHFFPHVQRAAVLERIVADLAPPP